MKFLDYEIVEERRTLEYFVPDYVARTFDFLEEAEKKQTRNLNWEIEEFR